MTVTIHHGDCREVVRGLDPVDAVVCDPPYGLKFMGKGWDHGVPGVEFWVAIMGAMRPGAHLLAFGGTRTHHRLMVAIEDAGFEIRDCLMWVYGSGFPKSLDVGKAVDKLDAVAVRRKRDLSFTAWMRSTGVTAKQINEATVSNMGSHYLTDREQPAVATLEMFARMAHLLPEPPADILAMMRQRTIESENMKRREVVGPGINATAKAKHHRRHGPDNGATYLGAPDGPMVTAPATDEAKQWDGWGTALKPAWEPIVMARKPLEGTVAANVLEHGVGGLNIDGCRVEGKPWKAHNAKGRWPANLIHDGSQEVLDLFPAPHGAGRTRPAQDGTHGGPSGMFALGEPAMRFGDSGSAARFFYAAKASKRERGEGNIHPTVKPLALMRYLCRLVTPPGGTILDPFMGSGSTLVAAQAEGFDAIGIDTEAAYCEIAAARVAA